MTLVGVASTATEYPKHQEKSMARGTLKWDSLTVDTSGQPITVASWNIIINDLVVDNISDSDAVNRFAVDEPKRLHTIDPLPAGSNTYQVEAVSAAGVVGARSNILSVVTPSGVPAATALVDMQIAQ